MLIWYTDFKWHAKTWFRGKIRSNFDIWPLRVRSNLQIFKKHFYGFVPTVKSLHCANFCPHRTRRIRMTSPNMILGKIRSNFDLSMWGQICKLKKKHFNGLVPMVKSLHCANFYPHGTSRIRMTIQNVIFWHLGGGHLELAAILNLPIPKILGIKFNNIVKLPYVFTEFK